MKMRILAIGFFAASTGAIAQSGHMVNGYVRSDGTYVQPHMASNPDSSKLNNYSTQGNINPYSGRSGTVDPYASTQSNPYGSPYNAPRRR